MTDIQSTTTTAATAATVATATELTAVPVAVTSVSAALENLTRVVQVNATPLAVTNNDTLTLVTALGNVTVTLAARFSAAEQQNLLQQLMSLIQTQRPLTLSLQPSTQAGSPPTQGVLLLPAPPSPQAVSSVVAPAGVSPPLVTLPPLTLGATVPAVVLPLSSQTPLPVLTANVLQSVLPVEVRATPLAFQNQQAAAIESLLQNVVPPPSGSKNSAVAPPLMTVPRLPQSLALPDSRATPLAPSVAEITPPVLTQTTLPQTSSPLLALLQPGREITLRVDAVLPAPVAQDTAPPLLAPHQVIATISGFGADGQVIVKAGDATLFVKAQAVAGMAVGTKLVVTVDVAKPEPLFPLPLPDTQSFSALPPLIAALAQSNPPLAQQIMAHVPQPTAALPGALLFLFSAFKQGDARVWLGEATTTALLREGKGDVLGGLSRALAAAGQVAQDPVVGEWRSYPVPLYAPPAFQDLTLHVHQDRGGRKDGGAAASGKIRFLIDMRLSKLGEMQIDGFVQPKKLDMILRSATALPESLPGELRTAYIKAMEAVGFTGTLHFQVGRQHWTQVRQAAPAPVRV